jgi:hypothetical protein
MPFLDITWFIITYLFVSYLVVLFKIIGDLFRDPANSGLTKALWMFALIVIPFASALVYLVARGGMAQRSAEA